MQTPRDSRGRTRPATEGRAARKALFNLRLRVEFEEGRTEEIGTPSPWAVKSLTYRPLYFIRMSPNEKERPARK